MTKQKLADTPCIICDALYVAERVAAKARSNWTVAQEYNKGNYQLITNPATLRGTNPKRTT